MPKSTFTFAIVIIILVSAGSLRPQSPSSMSVVQGLTFRTFSARDLGVERAEKRKLTASKWSVDLINQTDEAVDGLHLEFDSPVSSFIEQGPYQEVSISSYDGRIVTLRGGEVAPNETIELVGASKKSSVRIKQWWWMLDNKQVGEKNGKVEVTTLESLMPMPSAGNLLDEVFLNGGFSRDSDNPVSGLGVGIAVPENPRSFAWAILRKPADVRKSLYDKGAFHTGAPRGFNRSNDGKKLVGTLKSLIPGRHNNRLFAEIVALKVNVAASALGITPAGLGELVYEEGENMLNGLTIREILWVADSMMTFQRSRNQSEYINLDSTLRKINLAFRGEVDTISNISSMRITGITSMSALSFLRIDPDIPPVVRPLRHTVATTPQTFTLSQNYPNPFNPTTTIAFTLESVAIVDLTIFNSIGQEVSRLAEKQVMESGDHSLTFTAAGIPSGAYYYSLSAQNITVDGLSARHTDTRKMVLVK